MARERKSWQLFEPPQERFVNIPCYLTDLEKHQGVGGMSRKAENIYILDSRHGETMHAHRSRSCDASCVDRLIVGAVVGSQNEPARAS